MKTMIYGAGALGTILGALLSENGEDVLLVSRNRDHIESLRKSGAHITGSIDKLIPVKACLPEEITGSFDLICIMTKQMDNSSIVRDMLPRLTEDGVFCCLQNGVPEQSIRGVVEDRRIIGGVIPWSATWVGPGNSELSSSADSVRFTLGSPFCRNMEALQKVERVLGKAGMVELDDDILSMRWSKLLVNASVSALASSMGLTCGGVTHDERYQGLCLHVLKECIDVGTAQGIEFRPINDFPVAEKLYAADEAGRESAAMLLPVAFDSIKNSVSSVLQDLRRGKKTEVHAISGVICTRGRELGIDTPFNDRVVNVIERIESGELSPEKDNYREYLDLIKKLA